MLQLMTWYDRQRWRTFILPICCCIEAHDDDLMSTCKLHIQVDDTNKGLSTHLLITGHADSVFAPFVCIGLFINISQATEHDTDVLE